MRQYSDWFGNRFGELRLPQRSSTEAAAIEHAAIDLFIWILSIAACSIATSRRNRRIQMNYPIAACFLLRRVFYPQCIVNFSNFTINMSRRNSRPGPQLERYYTVPKKLNEQDFLAEI